MKGCRPADWVKEPLRSEWTVDPLIIDASFQLAGYWAWVKHQRAGFPVALGRFVQLAPFGQGPLKCTVTFEASSDDLFKGTLVWQDQAGRVVAYMTGAEAEFKKRDPQFQSTPAPKASAPVAAPAPESKPMNAAPIAAPLAADAEVPAATVTIDESTWNPAKLPRVRGAAGAHPDGRGLRPARTRTSRCTRPSAATPRW